MRRTKFMEIIKKIYTTRNEIVQIRMYFITRSMLDKKEHDFKHVHKELKKRWLVLKVAPNKAQQDN